MFSYKQPSDSSNSTKSPQFTLHYWTKKIHLSVMSLSLCSLVRPAFVPVVTRFSKSKTKPWPLLLFSMFLLDLSLVIAELMLDIGLVIVLEGTESLGTKTLRVVRCFITCVDLPKRRNKIIFYFKFLFSKGTSFCEFLTFYHPHYHWLNRQIDILELCSTLPKICPQII